MNYNFDEIINRTNTNCVKHDMNDKIFSTAEVLPMWVADMDFKTPDFVLNAISERLSHEILGYTYIPSSFYDSIINWNKRRHQWDIKSEWISFSPGVVPALSLLVMAFTKPGEGVIIQPPVYFPFFSMVQNHHRKLITNPLRFENGIYQMDFEDLEAKIEPDTKMMFLCNPHNPTGNVWPPEVLRRVAEICIRHNIILVSDEIHSDLILPGFKHTPVAGISDEIAMNTITCMAASKTFNIAGLSTAYLVIPDRKLKAIYDETLDRVHVGSGSIFGFIATEAAYRYGDSWLEQLIRYLDGNYHFLHDYLQSHLPMIKAIRLQATYLVWLDCRELGMNADQLKKFMIHDAGLGLNEGQQFGKEGAGFMRINIGCPRSTLHQALVKLNAAITKYFLK